MSMKNSNDTIRNRTRDLPAFTVVPQPIAPLRDIACINSFKAGMHITRVPGDHTNKSYRWVLSHFCGFSLWNSPRITCLAATILRWPLDFILENSCFPSLSYCSYFKTRLVYLCHKIRFVYPLSASYPNTK
jgi:hypothetical protein